MLNFLLKTRQNRLCCVHMPRQRSQKAHTLTTTSANGCRACCPRPTETASCKHRSNLASAAGFQLVERASTDHLHQAIFWDLTMFCHGKWGGFSDFSVSLSNTSYMRGVFVLALLHKDNKLLSVYRNIKNQNNFILVSFRKVRVSAKSFNVIGQVRVVSALFCYVACINFIQAFLYKAEKF